MPRRQSASLAMVRALPKSTLRRLNLLDLKSIAGAVLIQDRIEQFYDACYRHEAALRKFKADNEYCAGRPYCLVRVGEAGGTCEACRLEAARIRRGETRKVNRSEYGAMMLKKRREAR